MTVKILGRQTIAVATLALIASAAPAPVAHADDYYHFQSPSGNISCDMAAFSGIVPEVACEVVERTWTAPPRPQNCDAGWGDRIGMIQGSPPGLGCHSDTTRGMDLPTLAYGASRSLASLTCTSAPNGITCTDASTGHFFRISRESYELG